MADRVYLYDVTLRDGAQTQGVDFNVADKTAIAKELDYIGIDMIEGGWPGANPTDDEFFEQKPPLTRARYAAFGMTRRPGRSADNDPGLVALTQADTSAVTLVGKAWDFQVNVALEIPLVENIAMISDSIRYLCNRPGIDEANYDAEHFFDGYKANPNYAIECLKAALDAGARWLVLCDTNGGCLPHEIEAIVEAVCKEIPGEQLGIHCHNDSESAVANSLAAVRAGARHVQGTLNGLGERCGNANLISIIPNLILKMGYDTGISEEGLTHLTKASRLLDERLNRFPDRHQPYVGENAFCHKGGLHVSAMAKSSKTYEHIAPEKIGNQRKIVVSDQAGRANVLARLKDSAVDFTPDDPKINTLVALVKEREFAGFAYDGADASFELLARRTLGQVPDYFTLESFRVIDERRYNAKGVLIHMSEATVKIQSPKGALDMQVAEGCGPVDALDSALRKALLPHYPSLEDLRLIDYKVRILTPQSATAAVTRVLIESSDNSGEIWRTIGVSDNIIDASYNALRDALTIKLFRMGV